MKIFPSVLIIVMLLSTYRMVSANPVSASADPAQELRYTLKKISLFHKHHRYHNDTDLRTFIEHNIMPHFSFTAMAQRVTGPYARHMTRKDMVAFSSCLYTNFLTMLIQNLGNFDPERNPVQIEKTQYTQPGLATVIVRVSLHQGVPLVLHFRLRLIQHQWKIADIQSTGLSLAQYYRTRFSNRLQAYGQVTQ